MTNEIFEIFQFIETSDCLDINWFFTLVETLVITLVQLHQVAKLLISVNYGNA